MRSVDRHVAVVLVGDPEEATDEDRIGYGRYLPGKAAAEACDAEAGRDKEPALGLEVLPEDLQSRVVLHYCEDSGHALHEDDDRDRREVEERIHEHEFLTHSKCRGEDDGRNLVDQGDAEQEWPGPSLVTKDL